MQTPCCRRKYRYTKPETVRQDITVHTGFVSRNGVATTLEGIYSQGEAYKIETPGNHKYL